MKYKVMILALLLISSTLTVGLLFCPKAKATKVSDKVATASPKTIWVPDNYTTIQEAINVAEEGDTIYVRAGVYYEKIAINKNDLTLIGENKSTTVIDGNWTETVIKITANNVSVSGFTIRKGHYGIYLDESACSVYDNVVISNTEVGIYADSPGNHTIMGNNVRENPDGILIVDYNIVARNAIENNTCGIRVSGDNNVISENNVALHKSAGITIGLYHKFNIVIYNNITKNRAGVLLDYGSEENRVIGNTIASNWELGIYQSGSRNNIIHHNNVINNTIQVYSVFGPNTNTWDNGAEGNYWSDYNGTDSDLDGIGKSSYFIDINNQDNYPLMGMYSDFSVKYQGETYHVNTICNSTITNFQFNQSKRLISFNVTGPDDTIGLCRICIPHDLLNGPHTVLIDSQEPLMLKELPTSNSTHTFLYFTYPHSTHKVTITPSVLVVSPFWMQWWFWIIIGAVIAVSVVTIFLIKRRKSEPHIKTTPNITSAN